MQCHYFILLAISYIHLHIICNLMSSSLNYLQSNIYIFILFSISYIHLPTISNTIYSFKFYLQYHVFNSIIFTISYIHSLIYSSSYFQRLKKGLRTPRALIPLLTCPLADWPLGEPPHPLLR